MSIYVLALKDEHGQLVDICGVYVDKEMVFKAAWELTENTPRWSKSRVQIDQYVENTRHIEEVIAAFDCETKKRWL